MVSNKFFQKSVSDLNWTKVLVTPIIIFTLPALDPFFFDMRFQRIEKEKRFKLPIATQEATKEKLKVLVKRIKEFQS